MSSFYKMDPAAWDYGTAELSLEEEAAYLRIVNAIHLHRSPVVNNLMVLGGYWRCSPRKARRLISALIEKGKVVLVDDRIDAPILREFELRGARPAIPSDIREYVYKRDGECCVYCGCTEGPFELDHITPWSRGGDHEIDNLVVACRSCNRTKGDRTPIEMGWAWRRRDWAGHPTWRHDA